MPAISTTVTKHKVDAHYPHRLCLRATFSPRPTSAHPALYLTLQVLDLSSNVLTDIGLTRLAASLSAGFAPCLASLDLSLSNPHLYVPSLPSSHPFVARNRPVSPGARIGPAMRR